MICKSCGTDNPDNAKFCVQCGEDLSNNNLCAKCGHENDPGAKFCAECGADLHAGDGSKKKTKQKRSDKPAGSLKKKIWMIAGGILILLVLFFVWALTPPKECRPLNDALDTNEEFTYGCDAYACYLWLQNMEEIENVEVEYQWGDAETGRGNCSPDPDPEKGLRCEIALPEEAGSSLSLSLASDACLYSFTTLTAEEMGTVMDAAAEAAAAPPEFSTDPELCADFQAAAGDAFSSVIFSFSPVEVQLWPVNIDLPVLGLRYKWANGVSGIVDCYYVQPGEFQCNFPAEMGEPYVDYWLNDGSCESQQFTADQALLDWNTEDYASCTTDFVDKLKEGKDQWYYTFDPSDTGAGRITFWLPGITEFEGANITFSSDYNVDMVPADECFTTDKGSSGGPELACSKVLEQIPELAVNYAIKYNDCTIYLGYTEAPQLME